MAIDKTQTVSSQAALMYKALDSLVAFQHLVSTPQWQDHLVPLLKSMLIQQWLNPSDYPNRDSFFDAYLEHLAEQKVAQRFMAQFDLDNINARIKDLHTQILKEEAKNAG